MKKPIYSSPDSQLQQNYLNFLKEYGDDFDNVDMSNDFALLSAEINRIMNQGQEPQEQTDIELLKLRLAVIKTKLDILNAHRLEIDRREKRKHLKSVPLEYVDYMAQEFVQIVFKRAGDDIGLLVMADVDLVMSKAKLDNRL